MTPTIDGIAVFDLDGTLTRHDTFVPYLLGWAGRHPARLPGLAAVPLYLIGYLLDGRDRGRLKARLLRRFMGGALRAEVDAWTRDFVAATLRTRLCARARACIDAHRSRGDRLVLLSASVDLYVPAIGTALGFDEVICTGVTWQGDRLAGELATANRRGAEKARVVTDLRQRHPAARFSAYGNADSDFPHLELVDRPCLVNASASLRRRARSLGWHCDDWRAPGPAR